MVPARTAVELGGPAAVEADPSALSAVRRSRLADYALLVKARLSAMVLASGLAGYWLGAADSVDLLRLGGFALGTMLVVAAANALNQVLERRTDALMERTAGRPLPAGRMAVAEAVAAAATMALVGLAVLAWTTSAATAALGASALVIYVVLYTPLKRRTEWSTLAGAVAGAMPPLMGWVAAADRFGPGGWVLYGLLFAWQFPHTWAIAGAYEEDFLRAGYRVFPLGYERVRDRAVGGVALVVVASLLPFAVGMAGGVYLTGALALGAGLLALARGFERGPRFRAAALRLMAGTLVYLPLVLALLAVDPRA